MADVVDTLRGWSATAGSNLPAGGTTIGTGLDDNLRMLQAVVRKYMASAATPMASATTVDLSTADGYYISITGTTTITGLGTESAGISYLLVFAGVLTFTHNATSLILPGGASIITAAGDAALMISLGSGNWKCVSYERSTNPLFRAYNNTTQVISTGTEQKVAFQTEQYDTASCFDAATNYRFTPTRAGYYNIRLNVSCPTAASGFFAAHIYKNGARYAYTQSLINSVGSLVLDVSAIVYCNGSTDYVEGYFGQSSGGNLTLADGDGVVNFFEGYLILS